MLTITEREAILGSSINSRVEKHGDEDVTAFDIPLSGIPVGEVELNVLLQDPKAYSSLYQPPGGASTMHEPRFPVLGELGLKDKIEGAEVSIWIGLAKDPLVLKDCKLKGVTVELQTGGASLVSCKVQCTPQVDKQFTKLFEHLGHDVQVEIRVDGYGEQVDALDEPQERAA